MTASAPWPDNPALLPALAQAAAALARLDQASAQHKLLPALGHRARLDAVRRQAAVDGFLLDPWHLAALTEGLRPRRLAGARSLAEAGAVFEAGRAALALHRWLTAPDDEEEAQIGAAEIALRQDTATGVALVDAATAAWRWLEAGGARAPLPLTGGSALRRDGLVRRGLGPDLSAGAGRRHPGPAVRSRAELKRRPPRHSRPPPPSSTPWSATALSSKSPAAPPADCSACAA